jgi:hypothetical protein
LALTLVTPYLPQRSLTHVHSLLAFLRDEAPETELVVNDWGVLDLATQHYRLPQIVSGRLLNKMRKDPTILNVFPRLNDATQDALTVSSITFASYRAFLAELGVRRVEFDIPLHGLGVSLVNGPHPLRGTLYFPYGCVSTSRYCCSTPRKSPRHIGSCQRECRELFLELEHAVFPSIIYYSGKSQFYEVESIPTDANERGFDRVVWEPHLPR